MMPSERKARLDLERAVGPSKGRLSAAERWGSPLDVVCQERFYGNLLPERWFCYPNNTDGFASDNHGFEMTRAASGFGILTWGYTGDSSGASSLSSFGMMSGYTRGASMATRIRIPTAVQANSRMYAGLATVTIGGGSDVDLIDGLWIGMAGHVSTTHLCAIARKDGVATITAMDGMGGYEAIPHDTTLWYDAEIMCRPEDGVVQYYVDGRLGAEITTDLPSEATDLLVPWYHVQVGGGETNKKLGVLSVVLYEARP